MYSPEHVTVFTMTGFPIQKSPDQSLLSNSPKLIAAFHVFHRLPAPRHPPFALYSLATIKPQIKFKRFNANIQIQRHRKFHPCKKNYKSFYSCLLYDTTPLESLVQILSERDHSSGSCCFILTFNRLSKNKELIVVEDSGIEPLTSCVQGRRSPS